RALATRDVVAGGVASEWHVRWIARNDVEGSGDQVGGDHRAATRFRNHRAAHVADLGGYIDDILVVASRFGAANDVEGLFGERLGRAAAQQRRADEQAT